ncbi:hypothetical protein [Yersinia enterocolitica]|uniref:hypothetical protein n=1 Tax=Yersinia enterocolitica TaxID=630 RepID=UPI0012D30CF6|nr:hypothetical protein [Yersinia enterocolitica]
MHIYVWHRMASHSDQLTVVLTAYNHYFHIQPRLVVRHGSLWQAVTIPLFDWPI